jgi:hypothetical protein
MGPFARKTVLSLYLPPNIPPHACPRCMEVMMPYCVLRQYWKRRLKLIGDYSCYSHYRTIAYLFCVQSFLMQLICRWLRLADASALQPCCLVSKSDGRPRDGRFGCARPSLQTPPLIHRPQPTRQSGASSYRSRFMQYRARHGTSALDAIHRDLRHLFVIDLALKPRRAINVQTVDL